MVRRAALLVACILFNACASVQPWRAMSPDLRTSIEVRALRHRSCVVVNGDGPRCFEGLNLDAIAFSRTGGHLAYPARSGARWSIVRDGVAGRSWPGVGAPLLSSDGGHLAYPAFDGEKWRVVFDSADGASFDAIRDRSILFDPGGRRLAYVGSRGDSVYVVVDDTLGRAWDAVARLTFSADGARIAYVARAAGRMMLVVDGRAQEPHALVGEYALAARGDAFAYAARDSIGWYVFGTPAPVGPFSTIRALAFNPESGALSFIGKNADREALFVEGVPGGGWHSAVEAPVIRGDGRWGYIASDAEHAEIYLDGALHAREMHAADLAIGEGQRFAYVASRGDARTVVDDRGRHEMDMVVEGTLQFIDAGARWVCLAGDRQRRELFVVVDGVETGQRLDWEALVRFTQQPDGANALRSWVAASGALALNAP